MFSFFLGVPIIRVTTVCILTYVMLKLYNKVVDILADL